MKPFGPAAAAALVVVTNLAALGLGALNREAIESEILLTERELRIVRSESATALRVNWMQPSPGALGGQMVTRAGFRAVRAASEPGAEDYYARQLPRHAYVALEYDAAAWAEYRDRLRREPPGIGLGPAETMSRRTALAQTLEGHTRLFAVDVDADAARLRARHPDRSRYLITAARLDVALSPMPDGRGRAPAVRVREVAPSVINVPRPLSEMLRNLTSDRRSDWGQGLAAGPRFWVRLRYGRSLEPWVFAAGAL